MQTKQSVMVRGNISLERDISHSQTKQRPLLRDELGCATCTCSNTDTDLDPLIRCSQLILKLWCVLKSSPNESAQKSAYTPQSTIILTLKPNRFSKSASTVNFQNSTAKADTENSRVPNAPPPKSIGSTSLG